MKIIIATGDNVDLVEGIIIDTCLVFQLLCYKGKAANSSNRWHLFVYGAVRIDLIKV